MRLIDKLRAAEDGGPSIKYYLKSKGEDVEPDSARRKISIAIRELHALDRPTNEELATLSYLTKYYQIVDEHEAIPDQSESMNIAPLESSARLIASFKECNPSAKSVSVTYTAGNLSSATTVKFEE